MFICRVIIGGLALGVALKKKGLTTCTCFFSSVELDDDMHRFIHGATTHAIQKYLLEI